MLLVVHRMPSQILNTSVEPIDFDKQRNSINSTKGFQVRWIKIPTTLLEPVVFPTSHFNFCNVSENSGDR